MSDSFEGLNTGHQHELYVESGIAQEVIRQRYYQSLTGDQLPTTFAEYQKRDGLLIPIYNVRGELASFQLKPESPRTGKNGKPIKYETAANSPQVIDVPRACTSMISNPTIPLWITEGAKKVDSALSHGVRCIIGLQGVYGWRGTNADGGKTALPDWESIALNNREVVIAFDSDVMVKDAVRAALNRLASFLGSRGARVRYLLMPDSDDGSKCGLDDWFGRGERLEQLQAYIIDAAPISAPIEKSPADKPALQWVSMRDVEEEEVKWLWPGWIPKGMFTILGGYGGDGKSTLMASLIGAFTAGSALPDGAIAPFTNVAMLCAEDDLSRAVKPRLRLHNADMERVITLTGMVGEGRDARWLDIRRDMEQLTYVIRQAQIGLLLIDPLTSFTPNADRNNEGDVRDALQPLLQLAEACDVAVVGIMHIGKSTDNRPAQMKLLGSTAFTALARSVMMVAQIPDEQQPQDVDATGKQKVLEVVKSNYAVAPPPLLFSRGLDQPLTWHGASAIGVRDCYSGATRGPEPEERKDAETFLREYLADGPRPSKDVMAEAKLLGLNEKAVRRAKERINVVAFRPLASGHWEWRVGAVA